MYSALYTMEQSTEVLKTKELYKICDENDLVALDLILKSWQPSIEVLRTAISCAAGKRRYKMLDLLLSRAEPVDEKVWMSVWARCSVPSQETFATVATWEVLCIYGWIVQETGHLLLG
jgi:hypothetical protein